MTNNTANQLRGHCPHCGALQAVRSGMAHHGYTVRNGWFQGTCTGAGRAPMETSRAPAEDYIKRTLRAAAEIAANADAAEAGTYAPVIEVRRGHGSAAVMVNVEWEAATLRMRSAWIAAARAHARAGADHAAALATLLDKVHGAPLVEVPRADKPAPIRNGERRTHSGYGVVTACEPPRFGHSAARQWFRAKRKDGREITAWMGKTAWRALPLVDGE